MSDRITLEQFKENLGFFNTLYDVVRIVDPLNKQVIEYKESELVQTDHICYDYWDNGEACKNCISIRAYNEGKTFMKLESLGDATMLVTAIPVYDTELPIIVELLKDVTETMLINESDYSKERFKNIIDELNQQIFEDPLTSLNNRRFINERLPTDIAKATMENWPLSLIFMDVDYLKDINDMYGHKIGDHVLKEIGSAISSCIREKMDWAARYGGDEFLICLNNANSKRAEIVADRIRDNIGNITLPINDSIKLTVSTGIHTIKGIKLTAEELIHEADKKMYKVKKTKRAEDL